MFKYALLLVVAFGLDDSTMSLIANVDPIFKQSSVRILPEGLVQISSANDTYLKITQKGKHYEGSGLRKSHKLKIAPHVHLHDVVDETLGNVTPDVLLCYMRENNLSVRNCDVSAIGSVVPTQLLHCSARLSPHTISDLLMGSQTAPVSFADNLEVVRENLGAMETPTTVQVVLKPCDGLRTDLPDTAIDRDHVVFVLLNPAVESEAENFGIAHGQARSHSGMGPLFNAGLIFFGLDELVTIPGTRNSLATNFLNNVAACNSDGVCSANELVQWTPSGDNHVDWFVGTAKSMIRILS